MESSAALLSGYGIIVLAGGIFGYVKAKSVPSLISGVVSALVALLAAVLFKHHPRLSLGLGGVVGLTLTIVMFVRYSTSKKPVPALPVAAISLITFAYCLFKLLAVLHSHAS